MTVCPIEEVDEEAGFVRIRNIDARAGSPLLAIKPYVGVGERVARVETPGRFARLARAVARRRVGLEDG